MLVGQCQVRKKKLDQLSHTLPNDVEMKIKLSFSLQALIHILQDLLRVLLLFKITG